MKKKIIIGGIAILALSSCKKDYTCECVYSGSSTVIETIQLKKMKENDAIKECDTHDQVIIIGNQSVLKDCSIQ